MARTVTLDGVEPTQVIMMKDPVSGKIIVQATYRVKAGAEVVKTVPDRRLSFIPTATAQQSTDLLTSSELSAASSAWNAIQGAIARVEL